MAEVAMASIVTMMRAFMSSYSVGEFGASSSKRQLIDFSEYDADFLQLLLYILLVMHDMICAAAHTV